MPDLPLLKPSARQAQTVRPSHSTSSPSPLSTRRLQKCNVRVAGLRPTAVARPSSERLAASPCSPSRRFVLLEGTFAAVAWLLAGSRPCHAALVRFPADQLNNRYFLVRAGESYNESVDEPLTNPVWKTSEKHGLSELGKQQVLLGLVPELERIGACGDGCWLWPSITQNAYQTAEVVAFQLGIGRSRIVPEYSFLDARGLGALETLRLGEAQQAVAAGDLLDADWRPPKGTDGTPHESSQDVMVRMRQALSITETQYFGEDVLFVSPDSDCLSVLQAAVLGVDLREHRRFSFRCGSNGVLVADAEHLP
ncbi:hypothetical protein Vretimale_13189 [Volvox reticuliferus]|uniref:Phosphoglycerate mutase n=1 Tax=Volvox reticuliferus TaxID=1737510 RepID=A0A8J4LTU7_9CHLO|nr:hypothetical protein Vretifemale_14208 [Volvox reticuliferus]GIM09363.1 hypothetical protein Vretimale_13189 [Volvox reticuliferus]